jgi:hypothetical protein
MEVFAEEFKYKNGTKRNSLEQRLFSIFIRWKFYIKCMSLKPK